MRKLLRRTLALCLGVCLLMALGLPAAAAEPAEDFSDKWELRRDEESGTEYYALDAVYCEKPVSAELQHLVIYAPKAYLRRGADGGVTLDPNGRVVSSTGAVYSAETAPILLHNTSGGYSSSKIQPVNPDYLREGYIHVSIQTRGKETQNEAGEYIGQFPLLIVDMKAGIRFLKHFDGVLPGNSARIVSRGYSSGGAVSAMLGASGNSPVFEPYLEEIGAYDATDDIFIALASAPITNLSSADASYEWYQAQNPTYFLFNSMAFDRLGEPLENFPVGPKNKYPLGSNILGGAHEDELAALLYDWYVGYVQSFGLDLGDDGRSGEFYEGFAAVYADALAEYIRRYDELRTEKQPATAEEYLKSLDSKGTGWFTYDAATGKVTITDLDALVVNHIARKKMCPSLDSYNYKSNENDAFKDASGKTVHFSATVRDALGTLLEKKDSYGWTAEELAYIEALYGDYNAGISAESSYLLEVMSPINYVVEREGFAGADIAPFWRLRIGSEDGDHGAPAAWLIAEGLKKYQPETELSMGIAWGMGHSLSELTEQDLYDYIADIMLRTDALPDLGPDESASAVSSSQRLSVDGVAVQCPMVNIGGYNYFRPRDLAMLLRDTQAAFSVGFDAEERTVSVTAGGEYAPVGGELDGSADTARSVRSSWTLLVDGKTADVSVYNIGGSNYYKLRDLADAIGFDVDYINATRLVAISGKKALYTFHNDGVTEITDASLDRYFREGTAIEGVKALLRAGAVYVNGAAVPGSERGAEDFVINGFPSLWKTGEGTWAYSVHKLYSANDLSFEAASLGFIQGISKMRGLDIRLYSADGVYADRMEVLIKESMLVNSMEKTGGAVRIGRYDFALATNEIRPDVNDVTFPAENVDPNLRVGDIALYWCENGVWHIQQAVAATGTLTQGSGEEKFVLNGTAYADALITRYNLQAANRTSQFLTAHTVLSLQDYPVTMWSTETGYPIGFTRGSGAREALAAALANAEAIAKPLAVSTDGSDVAQDQEWVTAEVMDAYRTAFESAKTAYNDADSTDIDLDMAIYTLSSAVGKAGKGMGSGGLVGTKAPGTKA